MNSGDLIGSSILLGIALCGVYGLYRITKPVSYTKEEYEKRLKKGSGIAAGTMNALMYPLQELWHPKAVAAIHVIKDLRQGYYDSQPDSSDEFDTHGLVVDQTASTDGREARSSRSRVGRLLQRVLKVFGRRP
ncbi:MAG: hypothetical protein AABN95_03895 [Acidobacteriota bacterium]